MSLCWPLSQCTFCPDLPLVLATILSLRCALSLGCQVLAAIPLQVGMCMLATGWQPDILTMLSCIMSIIQTIRHTLGLLDAS